MKRKFCLVPASGIPKSKDFNLVRNGTVTMKFLVLPEEKQFHTSRPFLLFIPAINFSGNLKKTVVTIAAPYQIPGETSNKDILVFRATKSEAKTKECLQEKLGKRLMIQDD